MSIYYIVANVSDGNSGTKEVIYKLDATTEIQVSYTSSITSHPVESGKLLTDNVVNQNNSVVFNGYISDAKGLDSKGNLSTEKFINGITTLRDSKTPFKVYFTNKLAPWDNCFFTNVEFSQDNETGHIDSIAVDGGVDSFKVSLTIEQVRVKSRVKGATINKLEAKKIRKEREERLTANKNKTEGGNVKGDVEDVKKITNDPRIRFQEGYNLSKNGARNVSGAFMGN